jgi:hypothetical protein
MVEGWREKKRGQKLYRNVAALPLGKEPLLFIK